MKPNSRIVRLAFILALLLLSTQAWARPSACPLLCAFPDACHQACWLEDDTWTTCEIYLGGCDGGSLSTSEKSEKSADLCAVPSGESSKVSFDFLQ